MARLYKGDFDDVEEGGLVTGLDDAGFVETPVFQRGSDEAEAETRSVSSRCRIREQLNADIAAFLANGGCISHVEARKVDAVPRGSGGIGSALI